MLMLAGLTLKNKLFSIVGVIVAIVVFILLYFLLTNTTTILSKFGFETTTTLKAELIQSQNDLKRLSEVNINLNNTIDTLQKTAKKNAEAISSSTKEKQAVQVKTNTSLQKYTDKTRKFKEDLKTKPTTSAEVTLEVDALSEANIDLITEVYNSNFQEITKDAK